MTKGIDTVTTGFVAVAFAVSVFAVLAGGAGACDASDYAIAAALGWLSVAVLILGRWWGTVASAAATRRRSR